MAQIHHFDHGWLTPFLSYLLSVLGSLLGLICAVRLRSAASTGWRVWWLSLAAVSIGGTGIWTMHFVAMLGFSVVGLPIRYDVGLTAASALIAVVTVGLGLVIALLGSTARQLRIVVGGLLAGLGVAAMHYTGMAAMNLDGRITYGSARVALSVVIAVVAATVALWLALTVKRPLAVVLAAAIMGVAVNGMHFTGMSAMSVHPTGAADQPSGATATTLLAPIVIAVLFGLCGLAYALMAAPTDEDRAAAAYLESRLNGSAAQPAPGEGETMLLSAAAGAPAVTPDSPAVPPVPAVPARRPTMGSNWTFRDRASK
jgi:NO-binding membrane sensor protein with MHYT domain